MKKIEEIIRFNRAKEDNQKIEKKAKKLGFKNIDNLLYLGYDVNMKVKIDENGDNKVLEINGIDVSDKSIIIQEEIYG